MTIPKPAKRTKAKPKPIRRRRKGTRGKLRAECDKLWSLIVRSRARCEAAGRFCSCGGPLQGAHILPRTYLATRWAATNGMCLCSGHHRWFHSHPLEFEEYVRTLYSRGRWLDLREQALTHEKPDLSLIVIGLREMARQRGCL